MKILTILIVSTFALVSCSSSGPPSERTVRKIVQKEYPEALDIKVPVCAELPISNSKRYQCGITTSTIFDDSNYMTIIFEKKNNSWEVEEIL